MTVVISVENLSKTYRLGQIGTGTFSHDLNVWWAKLRGKPNPLLKIGQADYGNRDGEELLALRDVSFAVQQGEVLGIIGRNGAGKSTLLKILSRVTAPTSGRIKIKGRVASLLEVGTGFSPELTGRENIYLNGAILGMNRKEIDRKFNEIVDFAEVEKFIDTPVKRYSSGMYVRLAFAVAAHLESEILVVDEVLAVGDAEFQKKCLGKMSDVAKQGRTVFFVSHNMASIKGLCTRSILLGKGRIVLDGDVNRIVDIYLRPEENNSRTGEIPENVLRCGNGEGRFLSVIPLNRTGTFIQSLYLGEPFQLLIAFELYQDIRDTTFEVGISTTDGMRVITSYSIDNGIPAISLKPGNYQLRLALESSLLPGTYLIDVGIHHLLTGRTIDYIERVLEISVLNVSESSDFHYRPGTIRGYMRPQISWNFPPSSI